MRIEKITLYKIDGRTFDKPEKAIDHVENLILKHVQAMLNESGALPKSSIKATEYILKHRKELAVLLSVEPYTESEEE